MGFVSFWTGRDEKEADVYANYEKVDSVVNALESINSNEIENAKKALEEATNRLNSVQGVGTFLPPINGEILTGALDEIAQSVSSVATQIEGKADAIKEYEESAWYEKLGSTFAMTGAKLGEGFLSVFENLGDGVVSIVGWVAPKDSALEQACQQVVEKNWSHDVFNFYFDSDFSHKSAFTEDSKIAGMTKFAGQIAGYSLLGVGISKGAGILSKSTNSTLKAIGTFASSSRNVMVAEASLMGMGSGTESGLKSGKSMDEAALQGVKQAAIQGGVAWAIGTIAEKLAKRSALKKELGGKAEEVFASEENDAIAALGDTTDDAAQKLLTAEERLALPGETVDGTPVGKTSEGILSESSKTISIEEEISGFGQKIEAEKLALDPADPNYSKKIEIIEERAKKELKVLNHIKESGESSSKSYIESLNSPKDVSAETMEQIKKESQTILQKASSQEPKITKSMRSLESDSGELVGLEYKLKTEDSITRKVAKTLNGCTETEKIQEAVSGINDSVRYTKVINTTQYEQEVISDLKTLESEGYKIVKVGNSWANPKYKGLNVTLEAEEGLQFEVQFHTPESFHVKQDLNHIYYEINRGAKSMVPGSIRKASESIMRANQSLYVTETPFATLSGDDIISLVRN